jgi:hypothetical protein
MNDVFLKGLSSSQVSNWLGQNSYGNIPVPARTGRVVPTSLQYLVIGGGGGGGGGTGGGGGAGGYRCSVPGESTGGGGSAESEISVVPGQKFIIVVGAGGSGEVPTQNFGPAKSGSPSYFAGIISYGGGAGGPGLTAGGAEGPGLNGGCGGGGGGGYYVPYAGGLAYNIPTQGYAGGVSQGNNNYCGGGGGGAGAIGGAGNFTVTPRGKGGDGLSSAITGTSITRAGGGGGGSYFAISTVGGSGGGGNGNTSNGAPGWAGSNGTINTGSGGGGAGNWYAATTNAGGNGGKGIVIIRYPSTFSLAASTSGSPTQTTTGGYHIYIFNDSGSITF